MERKRYILKLAPADVIETSLALKLFYCIKNMNVFGNALQFYVNIQFNITESGLNLHFLL